MPSRLPRPGERHPERWRRDLNPAPVGGLNVGVEPPAPPGGRTAFDVKSVHRRLGNMTDDELKLIPILPDGTRLEQGATYIDLAHLDDRELTARGDMLTGPGNLYVAKGSVDYVLWNALTDRHGGRR